MSKTTIEWTEYSYNPITGCSHAGSPGCDHCYARRMARRLAGRYGYPDAPHHFDVTLHPDRLEQPLKCKKPTMYFVPSMGDLFHEDVPLDYIADVFNIMAQCQQHTFQILTKRPTRARAVISDLHEWNYADTTWTGIFPFRMTDAPFPLPNVHLGVSVENQATADERREYLRQTPAAVKFVSYEPALAPVDWTGWEFIDQIISGGESGPKARPSHPDWHRATRDFCQENGIAYFFKQWGTWIPVDQWGATCKEKVATVGPDGWGTLDDKGNWFPLTTPWNGRQGEDSPEKEYVMVRVGKKRAGHLLDGEEWREFPQGRV